MSKNNERAIPNKTELIAMLNAYIQEHRPLFDAMSLEQLEDEQYRVKADYITIQNEVEKIQWAFRYIQDALRKRKSKKILLSITADEKLTLKTKKPRTAIKKKKKLSKLERGIKNLMDTFSLTESEAKSRVATTMGITIDDLEKQL